MIHMTSLTWTIEQQKKILIKKNKLIKLFTAQNWLKLGPRLQRKMMKKPVGRIGRQLTNRHMHAPWHA